MLRVLPVSACAVLTLLLRRYSIHLSEDVEGTAPVGETFKQKVDRVMHSHSTRSLKPQDIKVVFRERVVEA